ncbi:hypothetical protein FisN_23Hh195 [Fistulifera solaris]|uniref:Uncharacterized protein n=1 Tax=Fistulifera solaris TaxID=1519565 RepID=A0A1Z5JWR9_FISSO|nr:hypothetical protein FisN_23Hh195 [Fistulifera solaris]|eukprot:GAX18302.1 hypothetical protein FisN_23Hh195 [Fistulifera solaris]
MKDKKLSFRKVKYYNSDDTLALTGDRAVGNFMEFAVMFLPLYWMHAVFVDSSQSFTIACIYSASRAIYPFVFPMKGFFVLFSTIPGYIVIFYLFSSVAHAVA